MASTLTRWFVVASPTGSTASEFFESASISDAGDFNANFNNLNSILGGGPIVDWGTSGAFPTYSAYSPGIYIRDYEGNSYTSSIYQYIDSDDVTLVTSIQQDLQKIFFPGIVTGSSAYGFGGKVAITASQQDELTGRVGSMITGSMTFIGTGSINPVTFANVISMSFAPVSFNRVNFTSFLTTEVDSNYQLIYRDFQSNAQAVYNVVGNFALATGSLGQPVGYRGELDYVSSTGTLILNNSSSITFIDTAANQQTFYVVGVANPADGLPFADQSTVGTADAAGDFRSGIIKVYATESNNTSDWVSLIRTVTGDNNATWDPVSANGPSYVAANHNLFMFTASAGSAGTGSWELLVDGA
jgi:hypothetical protein